MTTTGRPSCVLFLDDDACMRRTLVRYAATRGVEILAVATAAELRAQLAWRTSVDAVVCDFNLGDDETSAAVVRSLQAKGVPVVVLTGDVRAAVDELGLSVPVVAKDDIDELFLELRRQALEAAGQGRGP